MENWKREDFVYAEPAPSPFKHLWSLEIMKSLAMREDGTKESLPKLALLHILYVLGSLVATIVISIMMLIAYLVLFGKEVVLFGRDAVLFLAQQVLRLR